MHVVLADWLDTVNQINDTVSHPDFDATVHNPIFILFSIAFCAVALLRGWKTLLSMYLAGIAVWYVVANVVMKDKTGAEGGSSMMVFVGLVVLIAGLLIYFLLIRD